MYARIVEWDHSFVKIFFNRSSPLLRTILQAREAELERTVQELGAALVAAKNRASKSSSFSSPSDGLEDDNNAASNESLATLRARVGALELDLETANANLSLERERVSHLVSACRPT